MPETERPNEDNDVGGFRSAPLNSSQYGRAILGEPAHNLDDPSFHPHSILNRRDIQVDATDNAVLPRAKLYRDYGDIQINYVPAPHAPSVGDAVRNSLPQDVDRPRKAVKNNDGNGSADIDQVPKTNTIRSLAPNESMGDAKDVTNMVPDSGSLQICNNSVSRDRPIIA